MEKKKKKKKGRAEEKEKGEQTEAGLSPRRPASSLISSLAFSPSFFLFSVFSLSRYFIFSFLPSFACSVVVTLISPTRRELRSSDAWLAIERSEFFQEIDLKRGTRSNWRMVSRVIFIFILIAVRYVTRVCVRFCVFVTTSSTIFRAKFSDMFL